MSLRYIQRQKCCDVENRVRGPSRSDRVHTTSYWCSIVTMALYHVVFEIFNVEKCRDLEIRVRGHSQSLKVVPLHRLFMVSHKCSLLTLSLRYSLSSLSFHFKRPFSRWSWLSLCLLKQRMMEVVVTTGLLELKVVQSSSQIITTNIPTSSFLQARCPSCRPTNCVKALKGTSLRLLLLLLSAVTHAPFMRQCWGLQVGPMHETAEMGKLINAALLSLMRRVWVYAVLPSSWVNSSALLVYRHDRVTWEVGRVGLVGRDRGRRGYWVALYLYIYTARLLMSVFL